MRHSSLKCEKCELELAEVEANTYQGKTLCEDCMFDLMNPPKACDPTAVHSTLTIRKQLGQTGTDGLNEMQKKIYDLVIFKGRISCDELLQTLKMSMANLERDFAVLRHCELLRGFKEDDVLYFTKF
jgi:hypothetical protein